jgi:glycosyltransferase involved in cell wall biosynthesis
MSTHPFSEPSQIGFISTRFAGTDGVSLETAKWAHVLEQLGHTCFYFCGLSDRPAERSRVIPEAFHRHPVIDAMNRTAYAGDWSATAQARSAHPEIASLYRDYFSIYVRPPQMTLQIQGLKEMFKERLYAFARDFSLNVLILENALSIPLNLPLGLAITEFIAETGFPAIAHHHDFHWEQPRFNVNCVRDYIAAAFPPNFPSLRHVVNHSIAAGQLASRAGIPAMVIPNMMDFEQPPKPPDAYAMNVRANLGVAEGEKLFLQPTRINQRKGIEHAIELTRRVGIPARLVITHAPDDEGTDYERRVREFAKLLNADVGFESSIVQEKRGLSADGRNIFTPADIYPQADLVTYPSSSDGFGNAFLEAVYYRRPIVVNNYSVFEADLKPKGFSVIEFNGFIDEGTLETVRHCLTHPEEAESWADKNYLLARRYFSFSVLRRRLRLLLSDCLGEAV